MSTDTAAAGTSDETAAAANSATEERGGAALEPLFVYGVKQGTIHSRRLQKFGHLFSIYGGFTETIPRNLANFLANL